MNEIDRQLKRLLELARQPVSQERDEAPFGFAQRVMSHRPPYAETFSQPALWSLVSRWSLACACLLLLISLAFNLGLARFEWSPEMTVADPVTKMILQP